MGLYKITQAEADWVRARTRSVHIYVANKFHPSRGKTYYIDESPLGYRLLSEYWDGIPVWAMEVRDEKA